MRGLETHQIASFSGSLAFMAAGSLQEEKQHRGKDKGKRAEAWRLQVKCQLDTNKDNRAEAERNNDTQIHVPQPQEKDIHSFESSLWTISLINHSSGNKN